MTDLAKHVKHEWRQRGRCVECVDCKVRLYQGRVPKDKKVFARAYDDVVKAATKAAGEFAKKHGRLRSREISKEPYDDT